MKTIREIQSMQTVYENVHESVYRSYHILAHVIEMLGRGDSGKTILEVIEFLESIEEK